MTNWIEWHGGECPVDHREIVEVRFRGGGDDSSPGHLYYWYHDGDCFDIVEYQVVEFDE